MKKPSPEEILNTCISLLKQGKSISDCAASYPNTPELTGLLKSAALLVRLPKRQIGLNSESVWRSISQRIGTPETGAPNRGSISLPFFRLPFPRLAGAVAGVLVCALILNTTATAARNSIPGEPLYQVKRAVEKIQLTLALDDVQKTEIKLQHAQSRLTEAKTIAEQQPSSDPKVIQKTLSELTDTTSDVVETSADNKDLLKKVVELTDQQSAVLTDIESKVTGDTRKAVFDALGSSLEAKASAEKSLALLESDLDQTASSTSATTSTEFIQGDSESTSDGDDTNGSPTSTQDSLHTLGTPSATTTDPLDLPEASATNETTTPIILNVR